MKRIRLIIVIGILLLATPAMRAQDFLQKAKNYLDAGECEKAQMAYDAYKVENPSGNAEVERRIKECIPPGEIPDTKPPTAQKPVDGQPCPGAATVTDIDGNTYNTVQIGKQCWMRENLRTTRYADGMSIPMGRRTSTTTAYRYNPNDNADNVRDYGYLYNWPAVMHGTQSSNSNPSGVQGICPTGWHVPSNAEWTQLTNYVSSQSQYQCNGSSENIAKALASTTGWSSSSNTCAVGNDPSSNNATGFSALPAGRYGGHYYGFGYYALFWSATEYGGNYAYSRGLGYGNAYVVRDYGSKYGGYSVRCLRD